MGATGSASAQGAPEGAEMRSAPELSPTASSWHGFLLRKAAQRVTAMAEAVLGQHGLTMRHFGVLTAIEDEPGQNQRGVGERLRIDRTTVVTLTDDLENAGLVERRRGLDRRMFALYLTPVGVERLAELKRLTAAVHDKFLANLSDAERAMLRELLIKVVAEPEKD